MRRLVLVPALVLATVSAAATSPAAARKAKDEPPPEAIVVPAPESQTPPYSVTGRVIELNSNGVLVRVEPLNEMRRASWFTLRTPLAGDPLPGRDAWPDGFVVFELSIANASPATVRYSPMTTVCWTTKDHELRRLQFDQVLDLLRSRHDAAGGPDAALLAQQAITLFHLEPVVLKPGERVSRLLVYKGDERARDLRLDLHRIDIDGRSLNPRFVFDVHRRE